MCEPGYAQKLVGQTYAVSGCSGPESGFPDPERQTLLVGDIDNRQMNSIQRLAFEVNKQGKIYRQTFTRNPAPDTVKVNTFLLFSEVLFTGT